MFWLVVSALSPKSLTSHLFGHNTSNILCHFNGRAYQKRCTASCAVLFIGHVSVRIIWRQVFYPAADFTFDQQELIGEISCRVMFDGMKICTFRRTGLALENLSADIHTLNPKLASQRCRHLQRTKACYEGDEDDDDDDDAFLYISVKSSKTANVAHYAQPLD